MMKTRSRAAVLCFGGWGLQTMLHLWPRLRFIQEERWALGIDRQLPDLGQLTAFAAIMPTPIMPAGSGSYQPFRVMRPFADVYPPPFFVEQQMSQIEQQLFEQEVERQQRAQQSGVAGEPQLTYAERVADLLLEQARSQDYITEISMPRPALPTMPEPDRRVSRERMFRMSVEWAETAARSILRYVIDPTRLDRVQTRDPLVQTSLYVVASLSEPLVSALIWPILAELYDLLGQRHVVNVIGLFATGSFANDTTRVIEEAAAHVALMEFEGFNGHDRIRQAALAHLVHNTGKSGWQQRVGKMRFHQIYLIDREKTNQALAASSVELAVLAGNAIESLLVADGAAHIESQLGTAIKHSAVAHYNLLGAANNYVPFAQYIYAAMRAEQQRLIRELVLTRSTTPVETSLHQLGLTPEQAVRNLLSPQRQRIFVEAPATRPRRSRARSWLKRWRSGRAPAGSAGEAAERLPELQVTQAYLMPPGVRERLRQTRGLWEWRRVAEQRITLVAETLTQTVDTQQLEEGWGLQYDRMPARAQPSQYTRKTWAARRQNDKRTIPAALYVVLQTIVQDACAHPNGIMLAETRLGSWLDKVEVHLGSQQPDQATLDETEWNESYTQRLQQWQQRFLRAAGRQPANVALWSRIGLLGLFASYVAISWLLFESQLEVTPQLLGLVGVLSAGLAALIGLIPLALGRWRMSRLMRQRIDLGVERLSRNVNQQIQASLYRLYERVHADMTTVHTTLRRSIANLQHWAALEGPLEIPPLGVEPIHLRQAHTSDEIWQRIQQLIRERALDGMTSQERLSHMWQFLQLPQSWVEAGDSLPQRVRLAFELPLNQIELASVVQLEAQRRAAALAAPAATTPAAAPASPDATPAVPAASTAGPLPPTPPDPAQGVIDDLQRGAWCGYAPDPPTTQPPPPCSACPDLGMYSCPFSDNGATSGTRWSFEAIAQTQVRQATERILNQARMLPDFTRTLIKDYQIEELLLKQQAHTNGQRKEFQRDFIEEMYARAKPAGNFDVADTFVSEMVEIDFGVTADSTTSHFRHIFSQQSMGLLSSHDPMSIMMVRIVAHLALPDLVLAERCSLEYRRLNDRDRAVLALFSAPGDIDAMYGHAIVGDITYEPILHVA